MRYLILTGIYLIWGWLEIAQAQDTLLLCHQESVSVQPLENLNTKSIEFSPSYYHHGIVFVEAREQNKFLDPKTGRAYFDLMYADIGAEGTTTKPVSFSPNIRTQYHEGPCTFNADGTEMFFTRSNLIDGKAVMDEKGQVQLKIYSATKGSEDWENITALSFGSDQYTVQHPALSGDGQYLVFSSNMPGGYGGTDLYISNRLNGDWSTPINLGPAINTKENEAFPFWHGNGILIFASQGHQSFGGYDLFATAWNGQDGFKGLQHLDKHFNSGRNDIGMIISNDGLSGYFSSDRKPTKGKYDLYLWTSPQPIFCEHKIQIEEASELMVADETNKPLDQAYVWFIPMNQEGPSLYKEHFTTELIPKMDKEGSFYLHWGVVDTLSKATATSITNSLGRVPYAPIPGTTYIVVVQRDGYAPYAEVFPEDLIPDNVILKKIEVKSPHCYNTRFVVYNEDGSLRLNGAMVEFSATCLSSPVKIYTDD
ncbi:MAG TPA: hypothetical protein VJ508_08200, partial [Saprospiraceae bacterium]|nr:hypothetical protein [Saprospiraceae bacterium]